MSSSFGDYSHPAGCRDDDASLRLSDVLVGTFGFRCHGLRCLTIESEERETWTADVLADMPFLLKGRAVEERDTLTVTFSNTISLSVVRRFASVFGTRQRVNSDQSGTNLKT